MGARRREINQGEETTNKTRRDGAHDKSNTEIQLNCRAEGSGGISNKIRARKVHIQLGGTTAGQ